MANQISPLPLVVTMGEPAGVGADIILSSYRQAAKHRLPVFGVIGCAKALHHRAQLTGHSTVEVIPVTGASQIPDVFERGLPVLDLPLEHDPQAGVPSSHSASKVIEWVDTAVRLALASDVSGIVTGPIHKETLYQAGFRHEGHTDYLAHLAVKAGYPAEPVMMLSAGDFRTIPLSVHIPLSQVPSAVTHAAIVAQAQVIDRDLKRYFDIEQPRIAVAGLNPHAGENGTIGSEDRDIISPAIQELAQAGINAFGPVSADTLFHEEARQDYDAALCMYHDQALIPVKAIGFHEGVNTTLGLPFIRTSPDHGTALELAGTGGANPSSFIAAVMQAERMGGAEQVLRELVSSQVS
ncbi:4-hydroxythreonine-4-phosphate dehydrogenase PdxA [Anderseniella sp. Alg231-50]|uniref:4-hydroxythreonine-4-phosphate dehydrogenase PdxA n=1 Tax=Anderseniella sp. Alg231-50 TaxID=1922226 RepID=UPI000D55E20D